MNKNTEKETDDSIHTPNPPHSSFYSGPSYSMVSSIFSPKGVFD